MENPMHTAGVRGDYACDWKESPEKICPTCFRLTEVMDCICGNCLADAHGKKRIVKIFTRINGVSTWRGDWGTR